MANTKKVNKTSEEVVKDNPKKTVDVEAVNVEAVNVAIQGEFELLGNPLYRSTFPKSVTLRAMTTLDEKRRLTTSGFKSICNLINGCCVSPIGFDSSELKLFDLQYLMYQERIITYGPDYKFSVKCPHCGATIESSVNLSMLPVKPVDAKFKEPFDITLPVSGDVLSCKVLSMQDYMDIDSEAKRIKNKFPDYEGDPDFILGYVFRICAINGDELPISQLQSYVETMHMKDTRAFDIQYNKVLEDVGLDTDIIIDCTSCGEEVEFGLPITDEFFRPTI